MRARPRDERSTLEIDRLVDAVRNGTTSQRTRAAARLMTRLETTPQLLPALFRALPIEQWPRPHLVIGITGAPGTGKSTLVAALIGELRARAPQQRIGVIAVDPSSPFTGGAVLGDRVRMMRHATDDAVFIRSLATRGQLGGLSLGVKGTLRVLALLGCALIIIETVGVGQSEVDVADIADCVAVVLAPGAGDTIQLLKAGLLEIGDLFVVNKADAEGAAALHRALLQALAPAADAGNGRRPAVLSTCACSGAGVPQLVDALLAMPPHTDPLTAARADVRAAVLASAYTQLAHVLDSDPTRLDAILHGDSSVDALVQRLLALNTTV